VAFANLPTDPDYQRYIFNGKVPGLLATDAVQSPAGTVPRTFSHRMLAQQPIKVAGGQVRITDSSNFPSASTIAAALVEIGPGGMRELHWHPNADEWQYYIGGRGRMTVFASSGKARTFDYQAGDVGYVPFAMGHYIENSGEETLTFLEMFCSPRFADVSLAQWLALTPPELVQAHLNVDQQTMAAISANKSKPIVVGPQRQQSQLPQLPEWPATTIAVLSTLDGGPYAIPVTAPLRVGERRILFSLKLSRESLARLRKHPQAALTILAKNDIAFTARGRAHVVQEPMVDAPEFAAVAIDVEAVDDHRQPGMAVDSGISLDWANEDTRRFLQGHLHALQDVAGSAS
jgi:oxalate decarboxylase